ncbi:hypothetical protein GF357_00425 [Candidatus Dojkabacteria bacterium]|nr:hypothetical protein [Candidatus Dojkabacteria bacterium]
MNMKKHSKLILAAIMVISGSLAVLLYIKVNRLTAQIIETQSTSAASPKIYDRNGKLLYKKLLDDEKYIYYVDENEINSWLKNSFIVIEDQSFYRNSGVNFRRTIQCALQTIFTKKNCGGSTITQQYVKLRLGNYKRNLYYKIIEILVSLNLNLHMEKADILERYLNTVYFGGLNYGVESASEYYFGVSNTELSLAESAFLAAIPNSPVKFDPYENFEETKRRQEIILHELYQARLINEAQLEAARDETIVLEQKGNQILAPHVTEQVLNHSDADIITTIDLEIQNLIQAELKSSIENLREVNIDNAAAVMIDAESGEILAMAGSYDYFAPDIGGKFNAATSLRQPGSTLKPFIYALGLERGLTAATLIEDKEQIFLINEEHYVPRNFDLSEHGYVTVRESLGSSLNIPAVKTLEYIGLADFYEFTKQVGLEEIPAQQADLSVALGGAGISLLDLTNLYRVFPNKGLYHGDPTLIYSEKVEQGNGTQVFGENSEEISFIISDILNDNDARRLTFGSMNNLKTTSISFVKSGTSNDFKDAWAIGYNGEFVLGVWVGNSDNRSMDGVSSASSASYIWNNAYEKAFEYYESSYCDADKCDFSIKKPYNVSEFQVCSGNSGLGELLQCEGYLYKEYFYEPFLPGSDRAVHRISVDGSP